MSNTPLPSVGRVVHLDEGDGVCTAAIVTHAEGTDAGLHVMPARRGCFTIPNLTGQDERPAGERKAATWHWPERV